MDDNDDQGLHLDTGKYVEESRDYNPDEPETDDDSDESLVEKVKDALGVTDEEMYEANEVQEDDEIVVDDSEDGEL